MYVTNYGNLLGDYLGVKYRTKKVNWFTRRNKAIIAGFRI